MGAQLECNVLPEDEKNMEQVILLSNLTVGEFIVLAVMLMVVKVFVEAGTKRVYRAVTYLVRKLLNNLSMLRKRLSIYRITNRE